jgi:secreted trypsin-like serine protease
LQTAHCVYEEAISALSLVGGVVTLGTDGSKTFSIKEATLPVEYVDGGHAFDLAILALNETVAADSPLKPIPLSQDPIPADMAVTILGWGANTPNGGVVKQLHVAAITALDDVKCSEIYGETFDGEQSFCANKKENLEDEHSVDSCQGDTGGPVIFTREEAGAQITYLGGVISWGYGKFNLSYRTQDRGQSISSRVMTDHIIFEMLKK